MTTLSQYQQSEGFPLNQAYHNPDVEPIFTDSDDYLPAIFRSGRECQDKVGEEEAERYNSDY